MSKIHWICLTLSASDIKSLNANQAKGPGVISAKFIKKSTGFISVSQYQ